MDLDVVQTVLTLVLIGVTAVYVYLTFRLAKSAEEQIRLGTTPNLLFDVKLGDWVIINLGPYSAHFRAVYVEQLNRDEKVVGHGLLTNGEDILFGWRTVLGPNQEMRIEPQLIAGSDIPTLNGLVRMRFYFVYGPTGSVTHTLTVMTETDASGTKVHEQTIRLKESPPRLPATSVNQIQPVR